MGSDGTLCVGVIASNRSRLERKTGNMRKDTLSTRSSHAGSAAYCSILTSVYSEAYGYRPPAGQEWSAVLGVRLTMASTGAREAEFV